MLGLKMQKALLEHVNVTVSNSQKTTEMLCKLFGWTVRWSGPAIDGGTTYHVGTKDRYLSIYMSSETLEKPGSNLTLKGGLNHIGVVVENLEETEQRVIKAGLLPHNHSTYDPGRRFYFHDLDGIEYEVVSYN